MTKRIDYIHSSKIRELFQQATKLKDAINFGIGQPDFAVPQQIKTDLIEAINSDKTGYTQTAGISELKEKIMSKYFPNKFAEDVLISSGVTGGLFLSYSAILEESDELIIFDPYFVIYPDMCNFLNAKPVIVKTNSDFTINVENLKQAISSKTKAILINSPNNPTGYVYLKEELGKIVEIARQNNLWIISDEIYEDFDYDKKFISVGKLYDKTIVLGGFSKNFALTGLRLGYVVGPKQIIDDMTKLQQYTYVCAPSIVQYAVAKNFNINISSEINSFRKRRDIIYNLLKNSFEISKPQGAFYIYPKLPEGISATAFSEKCLENNLIVVPGSAFSKVDDYFRISYATSEDELKRGAQILIKVVNEMKAGN
ncbi:MAG: aminotransferase class I/II-fold pyridoxal phosphate-dependent enzyme, partial [archaeon]